jgi:prepilin-type N-terminal cleavage/methylation domain-containing protein
MKKTNNGFTLIELLVVIAIIGILAAIVLASLGTARNKGKIASATGSMSSMRAQAELGNNNGQYIASLCSTANTATAGGLLELVTAAEQQAGSGKVNCDEAGTKDAWAAEVDLTGIGATGATSFFCVDSNGYAGYLTLSKGAATTACI